jgi:hypothetical protein
LIESRFTCSQETRLPVSAGWQTVTVAAERINLQRLPEKDVDTPPDSTFPDGPCSRCGRQSNFTVIGVAPLTYDAHGYAQNRDGSRERIWDEQISILQCQGCGQNMIVVEEQYVGGRRRRDGKAGGGAVQWVGTFWWPAPGTTADPAVPKAVADAIAEGIRCLLVRSPRAAAVMFRGAIGQIVTHLGSAEAQKQRNLAGQLKQMAVDGALNVSLAEWADTVRVLGNAGAHPNELEPVSQQEADELARLITSIVEYLYVVPARVKRARDGRN